jgi:RNA polymerase sigma factor (sigma-70 family)
MATVGLSRALQHFRERLADGGDTDPQLLARFAAARDEAAFAALVQRHGPMVLAVCRRVLGHYQDAEDAFQATFLVLARKADSVVKRDSLGCFLHQVAYRIALEARTALARRRAREKPMDQVPHPQVEPVEPDDWRPVLDEELARLAQKYRAAVILCELEGRSRKEAARLLGVPEGTLSWRLARARKLLAQRLARRGLTLAAVLAPQTVSAAVPAALVESTVRSAVLVTAGLEVAAAAPAVALMKGVLETMFVAKLKLAVTVVMVAAALSAGGFVYQVGRPMPAQAQTAVKPMNELEALRKENELLKLNLQVVLEKVRAQEAELKALKSQKAAAADVKDPKKLAMDSTDLASRRLAARRTDLAYRAAVTEMLRRAAADPLKQVEEALKALRAAKDKDAKRRATEVLEKATKKLREQLMEGETQRKE